MTERCLLWRSIGQALIFTGEAVAVVMGGNIAYAFKVNNITWRAAPIGLAVASFCVSLAVGLGIKEPKKGRFIIESKVCVVWPFFWRQVQICDSKYVIQKAARRGRAVPVTAVLLALIKSNIVK